MSYLDHQQSLKQRAASGAAVVAIQAAVAVALVTGLTISGLGPMAEKRLISFEIDDTPPPPPEKVTMPDVAPPVSKVTAPTPPLVLKPYPDPYVAPAAEAEDAISYVPTPTPTPAPTYAPIPQPSPSFAPRRAAPIGSPGSWISTDDYPAGPLRQGVEGLAGYRLVIGSDGKVTACELTRSSGNSQLDQATCRYLTRRARFAPATDGTGAAVVGTYTGTVQWQIPE